ncbi:MAG TPA: class I SAM-dependent methyltransferase, partial [Methylomirabilota bacterium]|nr:class I SAM-dependent methyltransferase [Methylomirabilota bacterium]
MDVDWTLINRAKNLVEDQLDQPILKLPIIRDYREPLAAFLRPGMKILDIGANDRSLKAYLGRSLTFAVAYKSMDVDQSHEHDFYSLEELQERFDAIGCFEVVEHMSAGMALELFQTAHRLLGSKGRIFVSTPNVYHPMSFWSDSTHITPFRIRHLAGWMATAGFSRFWGYRVCDLNWKKRWRYWRYRG